METETCRWCRTRMQGLFCAHCDLDAHDPSDCVLCGAAAREMEQLIRDLHRR